MRRCELIVGDHQAGCVNGTAEAADPFDCNCERGLQCGALAVSQVWNPADGDRSGGVAAFCATHLEECARDGDIVWGVDE
jgi:hypothetical protein